MPDPSDYKYTDSHEWFAIDGNVVTMGITKYAADELTDITFVEMKEPGTSISAGEVVGEVESVKTTADVYSAVGGEIVEVNDAATEDPSLLNSDPMDSGWLVKIQTDDPSPLDNLMDHETYEEKYPIG
jgi:glycine cleavage system H protein